MVCELLSFDVDLITSLHRAPVWADVGYDGLIIVRVLKVIVGPVKPLRLTYNGSLALTSALGGD